MPKVNKLQRKRPSDTVTKPAGDQRRAPAKGPDMSLPQNILSKINRMYKHAADAEKAVWMKKYMRNQFEFFGIPTPVRKSINKEVFTMELDLTSTRELLQLLWKQPEREYQHCGLDLAGRSVKLLNGSTRGDCIASMECLKTMVVTGSWWDTVDPLATTIGDLVRLRPQVLNPVVDSWIGDDNMWLRRVAILHQLKYKSDTDKDKLFRFCLLCGHEKEFFIQKSIGWALRQYFRHNPEDVKEFVKKNEDKLSALSKREALKHA
ncbi:uncharacterized protein LOC100377502 [Saccoglossus kowalevskii]|uniref:Uncharacterized protein LOC100377502 n=1 Tax=Saccoglossus kowalevskii TaxID=10224 RepID=A0ABM0H0W0_SACKO|nr:PREDICTED: uncharacterized protein LOC100377502 [Saccoglossus kowalevskii]